MATTSGDPNAPIEMTGDAETVRMFAVNGYGEHDEAPGLIEEDREDLADARAAMLEEGEIPWEEVKAKLGI